MAINSRKKGKTGELEACQVLRDLFGWVARRTQQYSGWHPNNDSPDIVCDQTPSVFWEIKRAERLCVPKAMQVAVKQAGRKLPALLHRQSRSEWLLTIRLSDLPRLCHAYETAIHDPVVAPPLPDPNPSDSQDRKEPSGNARSMRAVERTLHHPNRAGNSDRNGGRAS